MFNSDIVILGGGIVGLSLAHQIIALYPDLSVSIVEKESQFGLHSSGRNSGVLHAGLYYKPGSLKSKVCVEGGKRLRSWVEQRGLPINPCGKVIVPQRAELDTQLEELANRGIANGAQVEFWDEDRLREKIPEARTASGRALWSPNTAVMNPIMVIRKLQEDLISKGAKIYLGTKIVKFDLKQRELILNSGDKVSYQHLYNCAGLHADKIAHQFGVGSSYYLMPFRGLYWQLKSKSPINLKQNIYPVPDLSMPFLGVHFTPSASDTPTINIGPTATPGLGREHYKNFKGIEPKMALSNAYILAQQYFHDKNNFRNYVHEQSYLNFTPFLLKEAQKIIPNIKRRDIVSSTKIAIRAQLYNKQKQKLEDDFICIPGPNSTHILNAISPAFTASFELADMILRSSGFFETTQ